MRPPLYPLSFQPILKPQIWGGRNLERLYGKQLPAGVNVGESWEIADRPEGSSIVQNGPLAGRELSWLMANQRAELIGEAQAPKGRYPLLVKILDAQTALSLQVHPPAAAAASLEGEPKTEMWYVTEAAPGAELFLGLRRSTTPAVFEARLKAGTVAGCFHRVPVHPGDAAFLPSGRVHALGAGVVLFEIQQNSNTTYRVFDWNRVDAHGRSRELHVSQALACIDFADYEPGLIQSPTVESNGRRHRRLVIDPLFSVELVQLPLGGQMEAPAPRSLVIGVVEGQLQVGSEAGAVELAAGQFCLVPAVLQQAHLQALRPTAFLQAWPG